MPQVVEDIEVEHGSIHGRQMLHGAQHIV
ncbi:MAG: hypothetical protein RLZZ314_1815, partial [Bacteroidota bacterium]